MAIKESAVGSYSALGGVITVSETWVPDIEKIHGELIDLAGYLDDVEKPLAVAAALSRDNIQQHFDTETAPDGTKWQPLNPEYLTYKLSQGYPADILKREGTLESAATSPNAYVVDGSTLFFDTGGLPEHWEWMQFGTASTSTGKVEAPSKSIADMSAAELQSFLSSAGSGGGRGGNTPARPFIGIDADGEEKIFDAFDLWFAEGVKGLYIHPGGTVQTRIGGRFGPKVNF